MNKLSTKIKYSGLSIKLTEVVFKIFIKFLVLILPKINREKLIKIGKKKNTICIVEEEYEVLIKTPNQSLAKERFKNSKRPSYFINVWKQKLQTCATKRNL